MTISYQNDVASTGNFSFLKLLLRWHGSVYKLLWRELMVFVLFYYTLLSMYFFVLNEQQQKIFEAVVKYSSKFVDFFPIHFVVGFFVQNVLVRWWSQYQSIPSPTSIAVYVSTTIHGYDEVGRAFRRTIMRYVCLSLTMILRILSPRIRKRFPKMIDLVDAGLLFENELEIIEKLDRKFPGYSKNFVPIVWSATLVTRARLEGRIHDDFAVKTLIKSLNAFRASCSNLMSYNTISIPLIYTQVVTIAVYSYFLLVVISQQYVNPKMEADVLNIDYIPFLIMLQFIFFMGWLKVAETLMNPFGEDDDDFEVNSMVDRNIQMSYLIVDDMHNEHPELLKDQYWHAIVPEMLPDKFKDETGEEKVIIDQDIVDFEVVNRKSGILRRRSNDVRKSNDQIHFKHDDDVEVGRILRRTKSMHGAGLIPRASLVTGKFNTPELLKEQKLIEEEMEKVRRFSLNPENLDRNI